VTGLLGNYEPALAEVFGDALEEVDEDAKPLAYVPITDEAISDLQGSADESEAKTTRSIFGKAK
jgi:hypothetical protein